MTEQLEECVLIRVKASFDQGTMVFGHFAASSD